MKRRTKGNLGEAKVIAHLVELDCEVYVPLFDNGPLDLIFTRNGKVYRVSVKSTTRLTKGGTWAISLRTCYKGHDKAIVKHFNPSNYEVLAIYVIPKDVVVLLDASKIKGTASAHVLESGDSRLLWQRETDGSSSPAANRMVPLGMEFNPPLCR